MKLRTVKESDYNVIHPLINDWWGGRQMADMLPKLFFIHFKETSFAAEENGKIIVGFQSQTYPDEAYIHFVGVDPRYRKQKLGTQLYTRFIDEMRQRGCQTLRCVTSPVNQTSIQFHLKMGFKIEPGDVVVDGVP